MLIGMLRGVDGRASSHTAKSVGSEWPDSTMVLIGDDDADSFNRILHATREPYLIMLRAGDSVRPGFRAAIERIVEGLDETDAGIIAVPESGGRDHDAVPPVPLLWRIEAILQHGRSYLSQDELPFPSYRFHERMLQLQRRWNWPVVGGIPLEQAEQRSPEWMQRDQEWALLAPILAGEWRCVAHGSGNAPAVTVVICMYNASDCVRWAIRSVLVQTYPDWELLLIDDGSTDSTARLLTDRPFWDDARIRCVSHSFNQGKSAALNTALRSARGRWLVELDADDWLAVDALETLVRGAEAHPEAGVLYADQIEWLERHHRRLVLRGIMRASDSPTIRQLLDRPVPLAPRMYRTALLRRLGGWWTDDPYHGRLFEDVQMLVRVTERLPLRRIPAALYHRRLRAASISQRNKHRYARWKHWMKRKLKG